MDKSNKSMINYIPLFLEYCKEEKNLSPKSIKDYSKYLNQFISQFILFYIIVPSKKYAIEFKVL